MMKPRRLPRIGGGDSNPQVQNQNVNPNISFPPQPPALARNRIRRNPEEDDPLFGWAGVVTALEYKANSEPMMFHFGTDGSGFHLFRRRRAARYSYRKL